MTEDPGGKAVADDPGSAEGETRLLSEREGRRPARSRVEPVPPALQKPLRQWVQRFLHEQLEGRIALNLGLKLGTQDRVPGTIERSRLFATFPELDDELLLDAIDLALQWDEALDNQLSLPAELTRDGDGEPGTRFGRLRELDDLVQLLEDGQSSYEVRLRPPRPPMLASRVDPTVQAAADHTIATAEAKAADRLRSAWSKAYGRDPDPDAAYADAVRAVEVAVSTAVSPGNDRQTLGTAVRDLRNGAHNYELVLLAKDGDGAVEPLLLLLERLWEGQKSRHGAGYGARPSTLEEARAAVHIAALVVQWLTNGALRRRPQPRTS